MELIKKQKWENLFKRRELVFTDAVKEFYARMTVTHLKKKDIVKSSMKGVAVEFDHEKLASILGIPGNNGICEYVKDVWEESKYIKPLEITRRRRDDDMDNPEEEAEKEDEGNKDGFDWEAVIDEADVEGESGSGEKFYDAEDKDQGSPEVQEETPVTAHKVRLEQKEQGTSGVDPSSPPSRIPEVEMTRLQAEFERKRANRFLADLEKAKAENARLLALLHQAQSKPHP
ncbi:hypothetical protein Dimus_029301 [Dionaea muscipula]